MPTMNTSMHELSVQSDMQEAQKIGRIPHWPVDTHGGNSKTTHVHLFPKYKQFLLFFIFFQLFDIVSTFKLLWRYTIN
jgi:hypothetical protein